MRKSHLSAVLARRCGVKPGRIEAILQRLADADLVSRVEGSRRYPPDLSETEISNVVLAVLADRGLHNVRDSVATFASLTSPTGQRFGDVLASILVGGVDLVGLVPGSLILRLEPASVALTVGGHHTRFGPEPPDAAGKHTILPGRVLAAVALELQGRSPTDADALVALASVSRSLNVPAAA